MPRSVHPSLDTAVLGALADSLCRAVAESGSGVLVHVVARPEGPDIGVLPLDGVAPADVLLGAVAPPDWMVLGVAMTGWAQSLDRPASRVRAEVVVLVARDGRVVGRVRQGAEVSAEPPAYGITLDCIQRALGLPTAPPGDTSVDWGRLRELAIEGSWPELGLSPEEAAWFDVGAFSRWVTGQGGTVPTLPTGWPPPVEQPAGLRLV